MKIKSFVINLKSRTDRRDHIRQNLEMFWPELEYGFFEAVTPDKVNDQIDYYFEDVKDRKEINKNKAKAACRISHLTVISDFYKSNEYEKYDALLVMEDDVGFLENMADKVQNTVFPADWDMLFLTSNVVRSKPAVSPWHKIFKSRSSACYLVARAFIPEYIDILKRSFEIRFITKKGKLNPSREYGFEHIEHHPDVKNIMLKSNIYTMSPLWATISAEGSLGYSNLNNKNTTEMKKRGYLRRINWYRPSYGRNLRSLGKGLFESAKRPYIFVLILLLLLLFLFGRDILF